MISLAIALPQTDCIMQLVVSWDNWCNIASGFSWRFRRVLGHPSMTDAQRSGCPINLTLEVVGDKWSLLIIRDMMFGNRRHFRELLTKSEEGISSNILADRLKTLLAQGIITWSDDPSHKQKGIYSLTEQGIELLPVLAQMSGWGFKYLPVSEELGIRAKLISEGGPKMWAEFTDELRETHLGLKRRKKTGPGVRERLQAAYEKVMAGKRRKDARHKAGHDERERDPQ
jgi:DNA-binding HxlR family transcriptional regulator